MVHRQVFIATHIGAGSPVLIDMLTAYRQVGKVGRDPGQAYTDPAVLRSVQSAAEKHYPLAKVFVDHLQYNQEMFHRYFYDTCQFIFLVHGPEESLKDIKASGYSEQGALSHYCFRLRRLCEMARKAKSKIVVTLDELANKRALPEIKSMFGLKELTSFYRPHASAEVVSAETVAAAKRSYERHLDYLRNVTRRDRTSTTSSPSAA